MRSWSGSIIFFCGVGHVGEAHQRFIFGLPLSITTRLKTHIFLNVRVFFD